MNQHNKTVPFSAIASGSAFSPANGEVGASKVFVKRPNGVCPQLGNVKEASIFWPNDRVVQMKIPQHLLAKAVSTYKEV